MEIISRKQAKEKGLKRYYTGKPCKQGHVSERKVCDCKCVVCNKDYYNKYNKQYREENKEQIKQYNKQYREENKGYFKQYYENNKEYKKEYNKQWREANKEHVKQLNKQWYEATKEHRKEYKKEYNKQWCKKNKYKCNAKNAKRRAAKLNATPNWLTDEDHQRIKDIYQKANELTQDTGIEHHVDHIYPLQGELVCGLHVPDNLRVITAEENLKKSNRLIKKII